MNIKNTWRIFAWVDLDGTAIAEKSEKGSPSPQPSPPGEGAASFALCEERSFWQVVVRTKYVLLALMAGGIAASVCAKDATASKKEPIALIVMDPLAKELACSCVRGHAQRDYHQLALHLGKEIG